MRSVNPGRTRGSKVGAPGEGTAQLSESAKDSGGRRRHKEGPTRLRLTYTGVVAMVFWLAFLLCALNTGTNLLFAVTGMIGSAILINLAVVATSLRGLSVSREAPRTAVAGRPCEVRYRVQRERGRAVVFPFGLEEQQVPAWRVPTGPVRASFLGLAGGSAEAVAQVTFARIGKNRLPRVRLGARGPFGLFERSRVIRLRGEVLVLPPLGRLRPGVLRAQAQPAAALARRLALGEERRDTLRGLRDHRPGDDPRAVHWRSTARRGDLVVKEFERTTPHESLILVDLAGAPVEDLNAAEAPPEQARIDAALILAASLAAALIAKGEPVALGVAGAGKPLYLQPQRGPGALQSVRQCLARAEPAAAPDLLRLQRRCAPSMTRGRLFLITTRGGRRNGALARARVLDLSSNPLERFVVGAADEPVDEPADESSPDELALAEVSE